MLSVYGLARRARELVRHSEGGKVARSEIFGGDHFSPRTAPSLLWRIGNERSSHAAQWRCQERVFFAGGFLDENPLARATIANSLKSLGSPAHFLRHSDFLGALGATAHALDHDHSMKLEMKPGMWAPGHSPPPRRRQLSSAADVDVP